MHWKVGIVALFVVASITPATGQGVPGVPDPSLPPVPDVPETPECLSDPSTLSSCEVPCPTDVSDATEGCLEQCIDGDCSLICVDVDGQAVDCQVPCPEVPEQGEVCIDEVQPPTVQDPSFPSVNLPNGSSPPGDPVTEYEHHLWHDGQFVKDQPMDGFDLIDLRAWEMDHYEYGAGVALRFEIAGNAPAYEAEDYFVQGTVTPRDVDPDDGVVPESATITLWSGDGMTWQSDHPVLVHYATQEDDIVEGAVGSPMYHVITILVPYETFNATLGDTLDGWSFEAYSQFKDVTVRTDVAPGGFYPAGAAEAPEPGDDGKPGALSDSAAVPEGLFLRGAGQHIGASGEWSAGEATLLVKNPYAETYQYVAMAYPEGAQPRTETHAWIAPGETLAFRFAVPQKSTAYMLQWEVRSSVGGIAHVQLTMPAEPVAPAQPPSSVPILRTDQILSPETTPTPGASQDGGSQVVAGDGAEDASAPINVWFIVFGVMALVAIGVVGAIILRRRM